jgi:hypothetical protein
MERPLSMAAKICHEAVTFDGNQICHGAVILE